MGGVSKALRQRRQGGERRKQAGRADAHLCSSTLSILCMPCGDACCRLGLVRVCCVVVVA